MNLRCLTLLFALAWSMVAQNQGHIKQFFYSGSNLQYACDAPASVAPTSVSVAGATLTNIVVSSNVGTVTTVAAHNLWVGARVVVSGSGTAALNATYAVVTVPSTTTYTITTSGVSDATYTTGLVITTNSPLLNVGVWNVSVYHYNGSSLLDGVYLGGSSVSFTAKCSDRATF